MGLYMTEAKLTQQGIQGLARATDDRRETLGKLMQGLGGKLLGYYFAFGASDIVIIFEAPSHEAAASAVLASVSAGTIVEARTTVLISYEEGIAAFKKAGTVGYTPPGR